MQIVVKALQRDGSVKVVESGTTGGDKIEVLCPTSDDASMRARGDSEVKRRSYDGYEGSLTGWLIPYVDAGDSVALHDADYCHKDGKYFVTAVETEFSEGGGKRKIELGIKL